MENYFDYKQYIFFVRRVVFLSFTLHIIQCEQHTHSSDRESLGINSKQYDTTRGYKTNVIHLKIAEAQFLFICCHANTPKTYATQLNNTICTMHSYFVLAESALIRNMQSRVKQLLITSLNRNVILKCFI